MESEDWLRNCGPYSWIGRHDTTVTWRLILIQSWWLDWREMGPWEGDICSRSRGYNADATNDNIDTNDISWDVDTTTSFCHYRFLASFIQFHPAWMFACCVYPRAGDIQHMNHALLWHPALGGESVVRTSVVISTSPQPSSSRLRHQNLYQQLRRARNNELVFVPNDPSRLLWGSGCLSRVLYL